MMDPNHIWNQMSQMYGLPHGLNVIEQAALQTGLSPTIPTYSVSSGQSLPEQSVYKGAQILSPTAQSSTLANTLTSRLSLVSSLNQKTERNLFNSDFLREPQSLSNLQSQEKTSWNLSSFIPDLKLVEPPPAHSGAKASAQSQRRPRPSEYQEQAALVELLKQQQQQLQQQADPPKAHQPPQTNKYLESYATDSYKVSEKYPAVQKYQDNIQKYQESLAQKYQEQQISQKYEEPANTLAQKYQEPVQKYQKYQDPLQRYKGGISEKYPAQYTLEPGERYQEDLSARRSQLHKMLSNSSAPSRHSYAEPSPPSHDSSPHMGHNSPQLQPHSSPQMNPHHNSGGQIHPTTYSTYSDTISNNSTSYIVSSMPSVFAAGNEGIMYEAVSPVAATSSSSINYSTVNLEGLARLSSSAPKLPVHQQNSGVQQQHQMQIPSPTMTPYDQQPSPLSVASPTSTVQPQQAPQTVRAQADSTTKSKRGRGRGGGRGGRGGSKGGQRKKKEEHLDANNTSGLPTIQMQHQACHEAAPHQGHLISSPPPINQHQHPLVSMAQNIPGIQLSSPVFSCPPGASLSMQQGLESMAHGYEVSGINDETMVQIQVAQGMLGMGESPAMRAEQEAILMMNDAGNSFMNPEEIMHDVKAEEHEVKAESTIADTVGLGLTNVEHKPFRTKAAQKQKPMPDDEFSHLAPSLAHSGQGIKQEVPQSSHKLSSATTKPKDGSFQSSFLSFLQGNKQETLSSVTNSSITNKPELPKYIPEPPRPKPKPRPPSPENTLPSSDIKLKPETVTFSDDEESSQGSSSVQINRTVEGVISNLSDDTSSIVMGVGSVKKIRTLPGEVKQPSIPLRPQKALVSPHAEQQRKPLTLKIKMSDIKMPQENPKSKSPNKKLKSPGFRSSKGKSKRKSSVDADVCEVISDDDLPMVVGKPNKSSSNRTPVPRETSPVPVRQKSSRKAKEKVEEKRKARSEKRSKKKKKKSKSRYESEDSNYSSEEDPYFDDASDVDKHYDSDKDPVWIPGEKNSLVTEPSDEESKRSRLSALMKSKPKSATKSSNSRRRKTDSDDDWYEEPLIPPVKKSRSQSSGSRQGSDAGSNKNNALKPAKNVIVEECDSDDNSPHQYMKGDFVMEKKELCNPDKYIIWKIDAGKLIQKFEPFLLEGKLVHKSLSTYSSWSDYFKPNYMGIQVRTMSSLKNQEVVEVLEEYQPKPTDEKLEKDDEMENFNVYVQILVSQSLEPGFLSLVKRQDEDYYTAPLEKMEKILNEKKKQLLELVKWTSQFKEIVDKYPLLRVAEKYQIDQNIHCQASVTGSEEVAVKTVRLYGDPYDYETLDKDSMGQLTVDKAIEFHIGQLAGRYLRQYHRIHHFKYRIYKKCLYMVDCCRRAGGKDTSEILDQCLQNRVWVQNLFRELMKLLEIEEHSEIASEQQSGSQSLVTITNNTTTESAQLLTPTGSQEDLTSVQEPPSSQVTTTALQSETTHVPLDMGDIPPTLAMTELVNPHNEGSSLS